MGPEGGAHAQRQERARPVQVRGGPQGVHRRDGRAGAAEAGGRVGEAEGRGRREHRGREEGQRHHRRIALCHCHRCRARDGLPGKARRDEVDGIEAARGLQVRHLHWDNTTVTDDGLRNF